MSEGSDILSRPAKPARKGGLERDFWIALARPMEWNGRRMAGPRANWTLADLVDFETELMRGREIVDGERGEVAAAARGFQGAAARRSGMRVWLEARRAAADPVDFPGRRVAGALDLTGVLVFAVMAIAGVSGVLAMVDRARGGIHVALFLAVLLGGQWLVLLAGMAGWALRHRAGGALGVVHGLLGSMAWRIGGARHRGWWRQLVDGAASGRAALVWRLARLAQAGGIAFNCGVLAGLGGMVLVRNCGFFWETTTSGSMRTVLERTVEWLAVPWGTWWPHAVPDHAVIEAARWLPDASGPLAPGPEEWWLFLLMATAVWGLLPRLLLWLACRTGERRALARLDFQGRAHRVLWRDLTANPRVDLDEKPMDGVLVLDVGGSGISPDALRPFLLRRLRVNPAAWESVAVLDPGAELLAARALAQAPAGVVLVVEGWALSPPRMIALHRQVRAAAGPDRDIKFVVVACGPDGQPATPAPEEILEWEKFVDAIRDPRAEITSFSPQPAN